MRCYFGDHLADPDAPDTHFMVTAWVSGPKRDGATLRENTEHVACGKCIAVRKMGQDPTQDNLFDEPKKLEFDQTSQMYSEGWVAGFHGWGYNPGYGQFADYVAGYGAGQQMKDHLDGYFFFEVTP